YYVDAIRVGAATKIYTGESVAKLDIGKDFPWLSSTSQQALDIERFRWFSDGFVARDPDDEKRIIDVRYSMVPNQIKALWGIEVSQSDDENAHVVYTTHRDTSQESRQAFIDMLKGND
ncbi:metal-dependent hydrolase, partial [Vibrio owensii]